MYIDYIYQLITYILESCMGCRNGGVHQISPGDLDWCQIKEDSEETQIQAQAMEPV